MAFHLVMDADALTAGIWHMRHLPRNFCLEQPPLTPQEQKMEPNATREARAVSESPPRMCSAGMWITAWHAIFAAIVAPDPQ